MPDEYSPSPEDITYYLQKIRGSTPTKDPFKPQNLEEYIGQTKAKKIVTTVVRAAIKDVRPLPNVLITAPYGQGKTSLARIMADMYQPDIPLVDAASVNKDLLSEGTYIVDEIHNLGPDICDSLNIMLDNNSIHLIGCTVNEGALPAAFRSRFRQIYLEPYTVVNIADIINRVVKEKRLQIDANVLRDIARRSRLNPRTALNYLSYIFDITSLASAQKITQKILSEAFEQLGVDEHGFLNRDYLYLNALPKNGRAVGLQYLSAVTSIDSQTIEMEVEPYLLQMGLIDRTSRGRKLVNA